MACRLQLRQDFVTRAFQLYLTVLQNQHLICKCKHSRPMRHHHDGLAALLELAHGPEQGRFAHVVQVGVGLIEHQERWITVQSPGQSDALALPPESKRPPSPIGVS